MTSWTALTILPNRSQAQALADALETLEPEPTGIGVFELEDGSALWEVGSYFTEAPDEIALALLAAAHGARPFTVSEVPDTDWVAHVRRELHPVEAGRFFVHGAHDANLVPAGKIGLRIEASMAFGTGHHGTTQGCLEAVDKLFTDGFRPQNVADIGCGTAVLVIAAAKVLEGHFWASDIDPVAVEVARANVVANAVGERISCVEAAGFDHEDLRKNGPYDLVFANILKGPLIDLAPSVAHNTAPGGAVILSGILNNQADEVIASYGAAGFALKARSELGEWTTLTMVT